MASCSFSGLTTTVGVAAWVNSMHGPTGLNYRLSSFVIAVPPTGRAPSAVGAAAAAKHWL